MLILVPSAHSISLHVVAVRLNTLFRYHLHINAARELATVHLMWRQQLSLEILHDHVLSYSSVILIFSYGMV